MWARSIHVYILKITRNNLFYLYLTLCCKTTIVLEFDHENSAVNYDGAASWYSKKKSKCKSQATAQRKNLKFFFYFILVFHSKASVNEYSCWWNCIWYAFIKISFHSVQLAMRNIASRDIRNSSFSQIIHCKELHKP